MSSAQPDSKERALGASSTLPLLGMAGLILWNLALILPLVLWSGGGVWVGDTYGRDYAPFELMGGAMAFATLALLWLFAWRLPRLRSGDGLLTLGVLGGLLMLAIFQLSEHTSPSWDWGCFVEAARALEEQRDPYLGCYLYPPLLARLLASLHLALVASVDLSSLGLSSGWGLVFYLYQGLQIPLVGLVALLAMRQVRRWGLAEGQAAVLVGLLLAVNNPLLRTLRHQQPNLLVLLLVLVAIELVHRRPAVAGFCLALAAHLKVLPMVLLAPWLMGRRWRALALWGLFTVIIAFFLSNIGREPSLLWGWIQVGDAHAVGEHFRDNSLSSVVVQLLGTPLGLGNPQPAWLTLLGRIVAALGALALILRIGSRFRRGLAATSAEQESRLDDGSCDALAVALLSAPMVWEHHYLMTLPLILRAWATRPQRRHLVALSALLMLGLPTFDVFLLSWHRLAGLLLWLWITRAGSRDA